MRYPSVFLIAVAGCFIAMPARAEGEKASSHQARFAACAQQSKGLKAEEHHRFMSDCLKDARPSEVAHKKEASQQNRMKTCNEAAGKKSLHGDERRAFMSSCLKG